MQLLSLCFLPISKMGFRNIPEWVKLYWRMSLWDRFNTGPEEGPDKPSQALPPSSFPSPLVCFDGF